MENGAQLRRQLDALHDTAVALTRERDLDALLEEIAEHARNLVEGSEGFLCILDPVSGQLVRRIATGPFAPLAGAPVPFGSGVSGRVWESGEPLIVNDYRGWRRRLQALGELTPAAVLGVPLTVGTETIGVIGLARLEPGARFTQAHLGAVARLGRLASLAVERIRLVADLEEELAQRRHAEEEMLDAVARLRGSEHALRRSHEEMLRRLAAAVEARDGPTGRHVERVGVTCERIARRLGMDDAWCEALRIASPLHDIGKIAIPDRILLKPGPLTAAEREVIERHTVLGHQLLAGSGSELLDLAASVALSHHERWDGEGYPQRLAGLAIPLEGRIAAVADVHDALTTERPYRPAFDADTALETVSAGRGTQFDPDVLDAFLDVRAELAARDGDRVAATAERLEPAPPDAGSPVRRAEPAGTVRETALALAAGEATRLLGVATDERQAIDAALRQLCERAGGAVLASFYVLDHDRLWCVAQSGYAQVRDGFTVHDGVMGRALRTTTAQFIADVRADEAYIGAVPDVVSELALPVLGDRARAILNVESVGLRLPQSTPELLRPLGEGLRPLVDALGGSAQVALTALARLCVYASSLRSIDELSEFAARTLGRLLDLEAAQLNLSADGRAGPAAFWRRPRSTLVPLDAGAVAAAGRTNALDATTLSVVSADAFGLTQTAEGQWLVWLPLQVGGSAIGCLVGRSSEPIELGREQAEAATLFAQHTAALLDVAQALRRERRAAVTDSLTGLLNRRGFDERLREELERAARTGQELSILVLDCDDLKRINDEHGHERGDAVLQGIARLMRESKRLSDVAARLGGDEFGLILPDTSASAAATVAERLRTGIAALDAANPATASIGIASVPADGTTSTALMRAADRALYRAKRGGKNRLEAAAA